MSPDTIFVLSCSYSIRADITDTTWLLGVTARIIAWAIWLQSPQELNCPGIIDKGLK
jgi:hypothetical protein